MRACALAVSALSLIASGGLSGRAEAQTPPSQAAPATAPTRSPDVIFVPTPQETVDAMLRLAEVKRGDIVYDLGSGDGRLPITAARTYGVRAVGIDIDPQRIREANANARAAGVTDLVTFRQEDLFQTDFREASVVTLYLLESLNLKLRPRLLSELKPGTRIVSHAFSMGDWEPEKTEQTEQGVIYLWRVPVKGEGPNSSSR